MSIFYLRNGRSWLAGACENMAYMLLSGSTRSQQPFRQPRAAPSRPPPARSIGALNGPFFPRGWGNLSVVNYDEDLRHLVAGPPAAIRLAWRLVERGSRDGVDYMLYEGSFRWGGAGVCVLGDGMAGWRRCG